MKKDVVKFENSWISTYMLVLDTSGSMEDYTRDMRKGLVAFKENFIADVSDKSSIVVSKCVFANSYRRGAFLPLESFDTSYYAEGGTALYEACVKGSRDLLRYREEVIKVNNCIPRCTFMLYSNGMNNSGSEKFEDARAAIQKLNQMGITTVFVPFGEAMSTELGSSLGFVATKKAYDLEEFMGRELSRSCSEQSKSLSSLGANFFSAADKENSQYSAGADQALNDDSWFENI